MGIASVLERVTSPGIMALARHWDSARGTRLMPGWTDIKPRAFAPFLSLVWAVRYDPALKTYLVRLAGEDVSDVLGGGIRGKAIESVLNPEAAKTVFDHYERIRTGPSILLRIGPVAGTAGGFGMGERIGLPLATDGVTVDSIIGLADLRLRAREIDGAHLQTRVSADETVFLPLN